MKTKQCEIGMVGLGVMGRNLVLNMADHGCAVAGYDKDQTKVAALRKESAGHNISGVENIVDFIALLRKPRVGTKRGLARQPQAGSSGRN